MPHFSCVTGNTLFTSIQVILTLQI